MATGPEPAGLPGGDRPPGGRDGKGGGGLPAWRFAFFALCIVIVLVGGQALGIPREIALPVLIGCLVALANGALPNWYGRDR